MDKNNSESNLVNDPKRMVMITLRMSHLRKSYLVGLSEVGLPKSISHQGVPPQLLSFICTSIASLGFGESWDMSSDGPSGIKVAKCELFVCKEENSIR